MGGFGECAIIMGYYLMGEWRNLVYAVDLKSASQKDYGFDSHLAHQ